MEKTSKMRYNSKEHDDSIQSTKYKGHTLKSTQRAYAKINLALDVVSRLDNGYHELKTIMQMIDLYDDITVMRRTDKIITLKNIGASLPTDITNLAYKSAVAMIDAFKLDYGYDILIKKRIPIAAGLAGGSSDGAAVIRAINEIESLNICPQHLIKLAAGIGADLPFCLVGGTALCTGIGDIITPIKTALDYSVLVVNNGVPLSTPSVFKAFQLTQNKKQYSAELVKIALEDNSYEALLSAMANDLTEPALKLMPKIKEVFSTLNKTRPDIVQMSGSGPTVFAIYLDKHAAQIAYDQVRLVYKNTFLLKTKKRRFYEL